MKDAFLSRSLRDTDGVIISPNLPMILIYIWYSLTAALRNTEHTKLIENCNKRFRAMANIAHMPGTFLITASAITTEAFKSIRLPILAVLTELVDPLLNPADNTPHDI